MFLSADCVPLIRTTSLLLLFFSFFFCLLFLTHLESINYHSKASDELIKPLPLLLLMRWNILQPVGLSCVLSFCFLVQRARLVKIRKIIVIIIMAQKISPHWARGKPVSPTVLHQDRQLRKCVYKSPHLPLPSPPFFATFPSICVCNSTGYKFFGFSQQETRFDAVWYQFREGKNLTNTHKNIEKKIFLSVIIWSNLVMICVCMWLASSS